MNASPAVSSKGLHTMNSGPRVRFAPSPTGFLHVGGARTALFNWLFARRHGGTFVLRIEDTDRARSSTAMTDAILEGLTWLGLDWDEGPHHQADGLERHHRDAHALLEAGRAYRCFCTPQDLETRRAAADAAVDTFRYDRHCLRNLSPAASAERAAAGQSFAIRFHVPDGETMWEDAVYGRIRFDNDAIEDFVVLRSDGTPVYNMAVVSDDADMRITHVIRGEDHVSNTPKQILIYVALGHAVPVFAHVPMILGPDGKRLSKRHGATAVGEYHTQGILPDAMVNFLALLGWAPGDDAEILSRAELVARFSLEGINRKSAIFDTQKLFWMNGRYLADRPAADLVPLVAERLLAHRLSDEATLQQRRDWLVGLIDLLKSRTRSIDDLAIQCAPYLADAVDYQPDAVAQHWKDRGAARALLTELRERLSALESWAHEPLEAVVRGLAEARGVGAGKVIHPLRVALTGASSSPGIFDVAVLLGRETVLRRIDEALRVLGTDLA
jgi:glutamyl-tRNA synthetase